MIEHADPSRTGGATKPCTLSTPRSQRIRQLDILQNALMNAHSKEQLERILEHRDGHGGLMGAFVRLPHPDIPREWIQIPPSSELIDVEGVVLGHQGFHVSLVISSRSLLAGAEIIMTGTVATV